MDRSDNNLRSDQGEGDDGDANVRIELGASNQRECNIGDEGNINDTASCSASIQNDDISQDDSAHVDNEPERIVVSLDDGLEMSYVPGSFKPTDLGYQVKLNDLLSGNMPFRQNANMDRGYMGSDGHEVKLTAEAVTGLIKMNVDESDASTDKQFIKALMIAIGLLEAFHSVNNISKKIKAFIKNFFLHRIEGVDADVRYAQYHSLLQHACDEIRSGKYD